MKPVVSFGTTNAFVSEMKSSRRGRPPKNAISKLKAMVWFRAVAQASGKTAAELEREFANPNHIRRSKSDNREIRPNLWDKYHRGEVEPRAHPSKGKQLSVVQAVDAQYPGTAKLLSLPLWKLLDLNQPVSFEELDEIEQSIPRDVQLVLFEYEEEAEELSGEARIGETGCPQHKLQLDNAIEKWTMMAIDLRRSMLARKDSLIGLLTTSLQAKGPPKKKR